MSKLEDLIESTKDWNDLRLELENLQAIVKWARESLNLGYEEGDRVQIVSPRPSQSDGGWKIYSECLSVGQTGVVKRIFFSKYHGRWFVDFMPDEEWTVHAGWRAGDPERRHWHGPVDKTPEGYEPPSKFDVETYPEGRKHKFMFNPEWLIAADRGADDRGSSPQER